MNQHLRSICTRIQPLFTLQTRTAIRKIWSFCLFFKPPELQSERSFLPLIEAKWWRVNGHYITPSVCVEDVLISEWAFSPRHQCVPQIVLRSTRRSIISEGRVCLSSLTWTWHVRSPSSLLRQHTVCLGKYCADYVHYVKFCVTVNRGTKKDFENHSKASHA